MTVHARRDAWERTISAATDPYSPVDWKVHDDGHDDFDGTSCATPWVLEEAGDEMVVRSQ